MSTDMPKSLKKEELTALIVKSYPFPIAFSYKKIGQAKETSNKLEAALETLKICFCI